MNPNADVGKAILQAVEDQVDAEIEKLDNLQVSDLEDIRRRRLEQMARDREMAESRRLSGHGEYVEIQEPDFFAALKKSKNFIVHFYLDDKMRCGIVDHHFKMLAKNHLEARFVKINAMNARFLCGRLKVKVIPTILIIIDSMTVDRIVGFTDLGNTDDFSTEMLEWRLGQSGVIDFEGDRPSAGQKSDRLSKMRQKKSTIRSAEDSDSEDEYSAADFNQINENLNITDEMKAEVQLVHKLLEDDEDLD